MAKAKSKEFILKRYDYPYDGACCLELTGGAIGLCYKKLHRYFGITIKEGKKKRVRITIEEVK